MKTNNDENWHKWKWSTNQGHETINFEGQKVKDQGHTKPNIE